MEILSSRISVRPTDLDRSLRFYGDTLGLAVYREWGSGPQRGAAFFLGGGLLEVSGSSARPPDDAVRLILQVRDLRASHEYLVANGVEIDEPPEIKPWGLFELTARDPDGLALVFVEVPADHPLRRRGPSSTPSPGVTTS